jgi:hypothetical protein
MRRSALAIASIALVLTAVACTPRDTATSSCLGGSRPIVVVQAPTYERWPGGLFQLADNTAIDARGRVFDNSVLDSDGYGLAVKLDDVTGSRNNLCFVGGSISTTIDPENTPWTTWHRVTGMTVVTADAHIVGTSFSDEGDGISFASTATNWSVVGVAAVGATGSPGAYIHDDCIQNDGMNSGLIDDSLFDGCMDFLSSIWGSTGTPADGSANTVEVSNTLVRLQPYYNSYDTAKYGFDQHGGFFKWAMVPATDGVPPQLYVHDSVFRSDTPAHYSGNLNGWLALPPNTRCDNVTLVGTSAWPLSDIASWTSQCTNLTFGTTSTWDTDVANWKSNHPTM